MFQTFSGSSRRPRQVNLSGQNANPFAASSWSPSASGTQKAVAHAQQEREQRQRERERLNASKRIQRVWRGHRTRRELAEERRRSYDQGYSKGDGTELVQRTQLLLTFCNVRRAEDIARLTALSTEIQSHDSTSFLNREDIQPSLYRLATVTLSALTVSLPNFEGSLMDLLMSILLRRPEILPKISTLYYSFLSAFIIRTPPDEKPGMLAYAAGLPVKEEAQLSDKALIDIYGSLALQFLTTPNLETRLGGLQDLASKININRLGGAIVREYTSNTISQVAPESRLWLLAHFIALYDLRQRNDQEPELIRALSLQLSGCSSDIIGRIDETNDTRSRASLPLFVRDRLSSLVNQASISGLLEKFNVYVAHQFFGFISNPSVNSDYAKGSLRGQEDASLLASYALTLLRIFPGRADEIRMWLCLGTMTTPDKNELPALKFFWQAMSSTNTFNAIVGDSNAALEILRPRKLNNNDTYPREARDREWRNILLFLELYTFVLKLTDDEEFLSGSSAAQLRGGKMVGKSSMLRDSALPLESVKKLTLFLKNISFTTFYNAAELSGDDQPIIEGGLGSYFGINGQSNKNQASSSTSLSAPEQSSRPFAGIAGMTFYYVRTIVIGVMRMLYERDSRRRFLPKDHWLMTARFDMEGFIPAVVMEEERRHEMDEQQPEDEEDEEEIASSGSLDLVGMARPRRVVQIERMRKQQQKAARQKVLAAVGPRLEVLQNMPFVIPFETRVTIFRQFVYLDQTRRRGGHVDPESWRLSIAQQSMMNGHRHGGREALGRHSAKIHRDRIFEDAYEAFYELGEGLKEPIQITFVDQFDTQEAGIDGGGVTKEFLTSITNEAFKSENGGNLFITNAQNLLYPNPAALDERRALLKEAGLTEDSTEYKENINDLLRQYEFLGRVVGKCLYEGILVDISFAGFFLLKWAHSYNGQEAYRPSINDLRDLDEELYQGLLKLKNYPGDVEDFGLDFTIVDTVSVPGSPVQTITRELVPNGSNTPVTNKNSTLYIALVARHRLKDQPFYQTAAFLKGLGQIINPSWLSMFNQSELQTLIGGESSQIDIDDLRRNTIYGGVYEIGDDGIEHPTIQMFWHVMKELKDEDRRKVLKYVTSTPRAPLLGFSQLNPRFSIRDSSGDEERLPSTSTCVNLLKLPRYGSVKKLREKLLYAVNSGAGFDLS
ncbi:IQ and HECT domain protein [Rutstroemia sp. NJR-2017a WRK4]|nr:IQ and HECT domain protein [Rutstroemia sp. NJR-2017a WRK4]